MKLLILAGYTKDEREIKKNKQRLDHKLTVSYLEGLNKALFGLESGYSMLQSMVDTYNNSDYISEIYVVGPEEEYKGIIKNCNFIDYNVSMSKNVQKGLLEFPNERIAISTCDIPFITTDHVNNYFKSISPYSNKDLIFQLVERKNLVKESRWKPFYTLLDDNQKKTIVPGHLVIIDTNSVPDFVYEIVDFIYYDLRGTSVFEKIVLSAKRLHEEKILGSIWSGLKKPLSKFLGKSLKKEELEKLVETVTNMSTHLEISKIHEFGEDVDTVGELQKLEEYLKANRAN
ncbi:MAG: NTP transferase domain-containing protein [archaeon]